MSAALREGGRRRGGSLGFGLPPPAHSHPPSRGGGSRGMPRGVSRGSASPAGAPRRARPTRQARVLSEPDCRAGGSAPRRAPRRLRRGKEPLLPAGHTPNWPVGGSERRRAGSARGPQGGKRVGPPGRSGWWYPARPFPGAERGVGSATALLRRGVGWGVD